MTTSRNRFQASVPAALATLLLLSFTLLALPSFAQVDAPSAPQPTAQKLLLHDLALMKRGGVEPSTFIVALAAHGSQVERLADELRQDYGVVVHKTWTHALAGLLVEADLATAQRLADDDRVRFVEQNASLADHQPIVDRERYAKQNKSGGGPPDCYDNSAPPFTLTPYPTASPTIAWGKGCPDGPGCTGNWGIDRIDDRLPGLDGTYQPMSGTNLVDVFIIDTSVYLNHLELSHTPKDQVFTGVSTGPQDHGTHVAGILAGKNFGVAQDNVRFHAVSFGTAADISIDGIVTGFDLVLANRVAGVPAVVSLSANGQLYPDSYSLADAVRKVIADGISVVNSAGNLRRPLSCDDATNPDQLAENYTLAGPTYPPEVLIVGATNDQDRVYCDCDGPQNSPSSDCGSRLASPGKIDLFAPGANIVSMATGSTNAICRLSGTSMAAPHVAGGAALLLSRFPGASPRAITRGLRKMANQASVRDHNGQLVDNGRILYVGDDFTDDQPVAGHKWYYAVAGQTLSIPKSDLVESSFDWEHRPLQVTLVDNPHNGQVVDRGSFVDFTVAATARPAIDTFSSAGFRFHISNGIEVGTGKVRVVIQPSAPPTASIAVSGAHLEYTFDGTGSTDDVGIVSYVWDFPGGMQKTGPVVDYFFPGYPTFPTFSDKVTLTVTDADGWTASKTVTLNRFNQPSITPRAGSWYNPDRSGHGISFYRNTFDQYVLTWFTYLADGTPIWYLTDARAKTRNASWTSALYKITWNGVSATYNPVGVVELEFDDSQDAWFSWTLNGESGGERFRFLHGGGAAGGLWYPPAESGWGLNVDDGLSNGTRTLVSTVTFYQGSEPRWVQGQRVYSTNAVMAVYWHNGQGLCPSCTGSTPPTRTYAGYIRLEIPTPHSGAGYLTTAITTPVPWARPRQPIQALTLSW